MPQSKIVMPGEKNSSELKDKIGNQQIWAISNLNVDNLTGDLN